ncbi:MAG: acyltransferase family protein, partial [Gemmatimonadaceae bacterium]
MNATRAALGYRPELDGLRAVAVLGVMVFHSGVALTGGFLGVDMFFVLSGFLITALLMEEWQTGGSISLRAFYARRAIRLLPALLGVLAVLWLAVLFLGDRFKTSPAIMLSTTGYTLGYMANWVMALHLDEWPTPLGHFWSLAVEEQFYLIWPVLLVTALTLRAPRWLPIAALSVAILAIGAWRAWLWRSGAGFDRVFYATD